ncbi:MAG TPA: type II toxin-antitoxin system RelE/ParE family toxin [Williamwhitmania sp.]|nr:type II toxin-antitoxin system RelE/ParE family toxin [Williamwhitmania sp.]
MRFKVKIEPKALQDIQAITDWYNERQAGVGKRFQKATVKQIDSLVNNPHGWAIRYNEIRCLPVRKFPYMVHFYINESTETVEVLAVISTSRDPEIWKEETGK